jgi:hypothetical protein
MSDEAVFWRMEARKAADAAARDKALSVPCPECKRDAGARCIALDTHQPTNLVHKARVTAWRREHLA